MIAVPRSFKLLVRSQDSPSAVTRVSGSPSGWDRAARSCILLVVAALMTWLILDGRIGPGAGDVLRGTVGRVFWIPTVSFGGLMSLVLIWRIVLWRRYRPMPPVAAGSLPSLTVVIPAYNEGPPVRRAILAAASSNYPADRLELIIVDDGSTDDTAAQIAEAVRRVSPSIRVRTLAHTVNRGKRHALHLGFRHARGDVWVTVDSDSILHPDALRCGVAPLAREPAVGCVAGCVEVLNPYASLWTRFLKCTFSLSFKFFRAYQNEFRGVFCAPGALSFFRADAIRRLMDEWASQTFLGRPAATGEDRALTNLLLRDGWLTAYQGSAVVRSRMPATFAGVCRMFLRWARSNIRETIVVFGYLFRRFRTRHAAAFRFNMLVASWSLFVPPVLVVLGLAALAAGHADPFRQFAALTSYGCVLAAIYYANERDDDWVWLLLYQFVWVLGLSWIMPWAWLTLRNTGWLTRGEGPRRRPARPPAPPLGSFTAHAVPS